MMRFLTTALLWLYYTVAIVCVIALLPLLALVGLVRDED